jgi:DNA-binding NarL/FixJ family response regulator
LTALAEIRPDQADTAPQRVLVVDDHEVVLEGLVAVLQTRGYDVLAASTAAEAISVAGTTQPAVALVDLRLPDASGEELCGRLLEAVPGIAVIVLTTYLSEETVRRALSAGARDYVTKAAGVSALFAALDRVFANPADPATPAAAPSIVRQLHEAATQRMQTVPLTPQQESVLELAAQGYTNDAIGRRLFITESTVRFHLGRLRTTFDARSKTELIAKAIRSGAIRPADEGGDGPR